MFGINIGANKDSADPVGDYVSGFTSAAPYADYITVNISSPNTPGLRDLQEREKLTELLQRLATARESTARKPPLFVKIAPDLDDAQMEALAETVLNADVQGLIVGNTTVSRLGNLPPEAFAKEQPADYPASRCFIFPPACWRRYTNSRKVQNHANRCAAVWQAARMPTFVKTRAGASLVQLYSALVFKGPGLIPIIKRDLAALLKRDGFKSVSEAVGSHERKCSITG